MVTNYPATIDTPANLPIVVNNQSTLDATYFNTIRGAIIAIETELGVKPSGIYTTVRTRLDTIENSLNNIQIITLAGDLGGTLQNPQVVGLRGNNIPVPTGTNTLLTWTGSSFTWSPAVSGFTAGGDLTGTATNQTVVSAGGHTIITNVTSAGGGLSGTYPNPTVRFPTYINVKTFGAVGDTQTVQDASISSGTNIISSSSAGFVPSDTGKTVGVAGAGVNGAILSGTLTYQTPTTALISVNASTSVSNAVIAWGTIDTDAIMAAYAALPASGGVLYLPQGCYLCSATVANSNGLQFTTKTVRLLGDHGNSNYSGFQTVAATRLTSTSNMPIVSFTGVSVSTYGSMVERLGIQGLRCLGSTGQHGIFADNGHLNLNGLEIINCGGDGIRASYLDNSVWIDLVIDGSGAYGINFDDHLTLTGATANDEAVCTFINLTTNNNQKGGWRCASDTGGFNDNRSYNCESSVNGYGIGGITNASGGGGTLITVTQRGHSYCSGHFAHIGNTIAGGTNNFNGGPNNNTWEVDVVDADTYTLRNSDTHSAVSFTADANGYIGVSNQSPQTFNLQPGCDVITNITVVGGLFRVFQANHGLVNGDVISITGPTTGSGANLGFSVSGGHISPIGWWTVTNVVSGSSGHYDLSFATGGAYTTSGSYNVAGGGTMHVGCGIVITNSIIGSVSGGQSHNSLQTKDERNAAASLRIHTPNCHDNDFWYTRYSSLPPSLILTTNRNRVSGADLFEVSYAATSAFNVIRSGGGVSGADSDILPFRLVGDDGDARLRAGQFISTFGVSPATPDTINTEVNLQTSFGDAFGVPYNRGMSSRNSANDGDVSLFALGSDAWFPGNGINSHVASITPGTTTIVVSASAMHLRVGQMVSISGCTGTGNISNLNNVFPVLSITNAHTFTVRADTTGATYNANSGTCSNAITTALQAPLFNQSAVGTGNTQFGGTGAPSNDLGINGDYYFRTDSGLGQLLYKAGGSWGSVSNYINVKNFGAKGDAKTVSDASITSGLNVISSTLAAFVPSDTGKTVGIAGAGINGGALTGTLTYQTPTTALISVNASTSVSNAVLTFGTNDTDAIMAAYAALPVLGGTLFFPEGGYLVNPTGTNPNGLFFTNVSNPFGSKPVHLIGAGGRSDFPLSQTYAPTRLCSTSNNTVLSFGGTGADIGVTYSSSVQNMGIQGLRSSDNLSQHGVFIDQGNVRLEHMEIIACGGDGIRCSYLDDAIWTDIFCVSNGINGFNFDDGYTQTGISAADQAVCTFIQLVAITNQKQGLKTGALTGGFNDNRLYGCEFSINGYSIGAIAGATGGGGLISSPPIQVHHYAHSFLPGNFIQITGNNNFHGIWQIDSVDDADHYTFTSASSLNPTVIFTDGVAQQLPASVNNQVGAGGITNITVVSGLFRVSQVKHGFINGDIIKITGYNGLGFDNSGGALTPLGSVGSTAGYWTTTNCTANTYDLRLANPPGTYTTNGSMYNPGVGGSNGGTAHTGFGIVMSTETNTHGSRFNIIETKDERNAAGCLRIHSGNITNNDFHFTRWSSAPPSFFASYLQNRVNGTDVSGTSGFSSLAGVSTFNVLRTGGGVTSGDNDNLVIRDFGDDTDGLVRAGTFMSTYGVALTHPVAAGDPLSLTTETNCQSTFHDAFGVPYGRGMSSRNSANDGNLSLFYLGADALFNGNGMGTNPITGIIIGTTTTVTVTSANHIRVGHMVTISGCTGTGNISNLNGAFPVLSIINPHTFVVRADTSTATYNSGSGNCNSSVTVYLQDALFNQSAVGSGNHQFAGTGVPSNDLGINGDFYFRTDGGALSTIYQKRSGTWVGIV